MWYTLEMGVGSIRSRCFVQCGPMHLTKQNKTTRVGPCDATALAYGWRPRGCRTGGSAGVRLQCKLRQALKLETKCCS